MNWPKLVVIFLAVLMVFNLVGYTLQNRSEGEKLVIDAEKEKQTTANLAEILKNPPAGFEDLHKYDGFAVGAWYGEQSAVKLGDAYLRLEPDVYAALWFTVTHGPSTVDSVAVYDRVARIRELREKFSK